MSHLNRIINSKWKNPGIFAVSRITFYKFHGISVNTRTISVENSGECFWIKRSRRFIETRIVQQQGSILGKEKGKNSRNFISPNENDIKFQRHRLAVFSMSNNPRRVAIVTPEIRLFLSLLFFPFDIVAKSPVVIRSSVSYSPIFRGKFMRMILTVSSFDQFSTC